MAQAIGRDELLKQLEHIPNPVTKLRQYFEHCLIDVALEDLYVLVDGSTIYFQHPERTTGCLQIDAGERRRTGGERPTFEPIVVFHDHEVYVTINGLVAFFDWDEQQTKEFVERCLRRALEVDSRYMKREIARWAGDWELGATRRALELYVAPDSELYALVHRWLLIGWTFCGADLWGKPDEFLHQWLGFVPPQYIRRERKFPETYVLSLARDTLIAQATFNKLVALGMDHREVESLFSDWMIKYGEEGLDLLWPAAMALAGHCSYGRRQEVAQRVRTRFLGGTYDWFRMLFNDLDPYASVYLRPLLKAALAKEDEEIRAALLAKVTSAISRGEVGRATWALHEVASDVGLKDPSILVLLPAAVEEARTNQRYGVAAALVDRFGLETCIDEEALELDLESCEEDEVEARRLAKLAREGELQACAGLASTFGQSVSIQL